MAEAMPATPTATDAPSVATPSTEQKPTTPAATPHAEGHPSAAPDVADSKSSTIGEPQLGTAPSADAKPGDAPAEQSPADGASPTADGAMASEAASDVGPMTPPKDVIMASPATETPIVEKPVDPLDLRWDYSQPLPNRYFLPTLADLCVPVMAKNFAKFPGFGGIPLDERLRVVQEIPLDLPLKLAADMIPEEAYWKRRVQINWRNCDIVAHGRSWKQMFFERNLQDVLERYDVTTEKEQDLVELMKISAPYVHNLDLMQLPSHVDFKLIFYVLKRGLTGLRVNYGILDTPGAKFDWSKWGMKISDCRSLSAALTITATLTTLNLSGNRLDAEKMGILAKGLMANPTVVDLDLSGNILADEGVKHLAYVLKNKNSVLGMLNLTSNHITAQGCRYLAECEDINRSLVSINLTFNIFGDLGGKRILDWANNNPIIQRISMESCDIGEDSVQSFTRLMHNVHSTLTALNISGNRAIGMKGGRILLDGLEAGKQMKELRIVNCDCGEELENKVLSFLVERKYGQTSIHHAWEPEPNIDRLRKTTPPPEPAPTETEEEKKRREEEDETKKKEEKDKKDEESSEVSKGDEDEQGKVDKEKTEEQNKDEALTKGEVPLETEEKHMDEDEDNILHVGHAHNEACTLECSRMVGMPSLKRPPVPVVYPETAFAARDAQAAIKKIEDAKPYWGLEAMKDMKEKTQEFEAVPHLLPEI